ncbi:DUF2271 domain-containing protein [Aquirufa ecclesiirivi]|uniref:DUF2271 domain-containing protein n=1 Tax=Aquirufa ecclesiirivi TaxID=2715124 RepID=UPI003BAFE873
MLKSLGLAALSVTSPQLLATQSSGIYVSQMDYLLGTSLDLKIAASHYGAAKKAEASLLAEVKRLSQILGTYHLSTEFNQWMASQGEFKSVSHDLFQVLQQFDTWKEKTGGLINASAEEIAQVWKSASAQNQFPRDENIQAAVHVAQQKHWEINETEQSIARTSQAALQLHSFAKSYVMQKAADVALATEGVHGIVLNVGGDIIVQGNGMDQISIKDPRNFAENAAPYAQILVENKAVATSGDYQRGFEINKQWFSHVMNPLTGQPASEIISATVVHPDAVTAGALSTAFQVMSPEQSQQLASSISDTDYLILTKSGEEYTSPNWSNLLASNAPNARPSSLSTNILMVNQKDKMWTDKQELQIKFELASFEGRFRRPFVAVWVEDENHKPIRRIALWFNKPRWLPDLRSWYAAQREKAIDIASLASATRSPGEYTLVWDGKDDAGQFVKQGKYTVYIEAAREHGTYQLMKQEMNFNGKDQKQTLSGNEEVTGASLNYVAK